VQDILTTGEVADAFGVNPKTVTHWAAQGRIRCLKTPGGRNRFRHEDIHPFLVVTAATATELEPMVGSAVLQGS
jgi:excisionase family DNA binding protein